VTQSATARVRKFPCQSCGADVRWDPGASALKCPYCGAEKRIAAPSGTISEQSVDAGLRKPRDLGWGAERKVVACKRCGAHTTLEPHVAASHCPFCGTAAIVESPPDPNVIRPEGLLPFRVPRASAVDQFQQWLRSLWLRPNDLRSASRLTEMRGVYIPFWTFDAATHSWWTAEAGYYYTVTVRDSQGRSRQEIRIRWEPASGSLELFFDDVPIPASRGIDHRLARGIEPFPTSDLTPYEPSYLSGFLAEENAVDLPEALESAKERMRGDIRAACAREVPGDTHRNLEVRTTFSGLAYKNALLPIWIAAYEYHGNPYRYIVNGVTGKAHGTAPWSAVKIALLVIAAVIVIIVLFAMSES
jgi:predicted RNA-binding Zn-ribbon protein involved in translation (DUF1610 family)